MSATPSPVSLSLTIDEYSDAEDALTFIADLAYLLECIPEKYGDAARSVATVMREITKKAEAVDELLATAQKRQVKGAR